jgi:putative peptide zinc metalloprotease protein
MFRSRRARFVAAAALLLAAFVFVPVDMHVTTQAILRPAKTFEIYVPAASSVQTPPAPAGTIVLAGAVVASLSSPEIDYRARLAETRRARIEAQLRAAALDESLQGQMPVLREQLAAADAEISGLVQEAERLEPTAPFRGVLVDPMPDLHAGDTLGRNERLVTLVDSSEWEVRAYVEERDLARVSVGAAAVFYAEGGTEEALELTIARIDRDASRTLPEALLGSAHGGELPVHAIRDSQIPERAIYSVTLKVRDSESIRAVRQLRGHVVIRARARTLAAEYLETAASVIIRELGW